MIFLFALASVAQGACPTLTPSPRRIRRWASFVWSGIYVYSYQVPERLVPAVVGVGRAQLEVLFVVVRLGLVVVDGAGRAALGACRFCHLKTRAEPKKEPVSR